MNINAGLDSYAYGTLLILCSKNNWNRSEGVVNLVRESRSFQSILGDVINRRSHRNLISGVVRNRRHAQCGKIRAITVSGFTDSEVTAISRFALMSEITINYAVMKLLLESPTFMAFYDRRTVTEAPPNTAQVITASPHL